MRSCCEQGLTHARVTFLVEASGEYTYYELKLTSGAPAPVGQLALECPVRSQTGASISITNPLAAPVTLQPTITSKQARAADAVRLLAALCASGRNCLPALPCTHIHLAALIALHALPPQVSLLPDPPVLPPLSTTALDVHFRPLLVGSSDASLRLDSAELGSYEWALRLTGASTNPERSLAFSVPLGTRDTHVRAHVLQECMHVHVDALQDCMHVDACACMFYGVAHALP